MPFDPTGGMVKDAIYAIVKKIYNASSYGQMQASINELDQYLKEKGILDEAISPLMEHLQALLADSKDARQQREDIIQIVKQIAEQVEPVQPSVPTFPIFTVPLSKNPDFTGREDLLNELRKRLGGGETMAVTEASLQTVTGLGGVGKTQLVLEYAYKHRDEYQLVAWLRAEDARFISDDLAALAAELGLPEKDATEQELAVKATLSWLGRNNGWLLVYDNAESPQAVQSFLPLGGRGHTIITSRYRHWRGVARTLEVPTFPRPESIEFIRKRTGTDDTETADKLAEELGDLPLALEQACAYIEECEKQLAEYVRLLEEQQSELLDKYAPGSHEASVAKTFGLAIDCLSEEEPAAADLLNLCAFFAPDGIPLEAISLIANELPESIPEPLRSVAQDEMKFDAAVAALLRFSLVEKEGDFLFIHRLVQAVARERMIVEGRKVWATAAVTILYNIFPFQTDDVRTWPAIKVLFPHALLAANETYKQRICLEATANLFVKIGLYQEARAQYAIAKELYKKALTIGENVYGPNHPEVATWTNNLGGVLRALGDLAGAKANYERVLVILKKTEEGEEHPHFAAAINNLGGVLKDLGDLAGAKANYERALRIWKKEFGPEHPTVAYGYNNIGEVLQESGKPKDLKEAKEKHEQALNIRRKKLGEDHPLTAASYNNLGGVLWYLGDLAGAKKHFEWALAIDEKHFGPDHPNVAIRLNNLGSVLKALGDLAGAKANYKRALAIDEKHFGPDHTNVAYRVNNLGTLYYEMKDLQKAKTYLEHALQIWQNAYGEEHPLTQRARENMAVVLEEMKEK